MNLPVDWWKAMGSPDMAVLAVLGCGEKICFPWERLVKLRGKKRRLAISEVVKRDGVNCFFCGLPYGSDPCLEFTLHHLDWKNTHNHLHNLKVAHGPCNSSETQKHTQSLKRPSSTPLLAERERKTGVGGRGFARWSSREGEKHDAMRPRWNNWLGDWVNGPFRGVGGTIRVGRLAEMAVHGLGMGSSETYRRYVMEDGAGGPLELWREGGIWWARYVGGGSNPDGDVELASLASEARSPQASAVGSSQQ